MSEEPEIAAGTTDRSNTGALANFKPGERVRHAELGEGVVIATPLEGFIKVFFPSGERQLPVAGLTAALSRSEIAVVNAKGDPKRALRAWLCYQAHVLPLMENVSSLTSAKIDLLPHQVVLTHRVATASPRRFLIADEVGLGKTIETALILRELISRGELKRALMVVPAGLVNNWHRELNEVFHLNFEVFGSEGDVTDRKSNAFEKHNLLIASIDTLKMRARMARLKAAPPWDLVVFDEAHHLSAYRQNGKLVKTQNFKLAEMLKEHTRDLVLLSATPHQGDHFRFWMLVHRDGRAAASAQHCHLSPDQGRCLSSRRFDAICAPAGAYRGVHDVGCREGVLRRVSGLFA
jgi:hypothetical protein